MISKAATIKDPPQKPTAVGTLSSSVGGTNVKKPMRPPPAAPFASLKLGLPQSSSSSDSHSNPSSPSPSPRSGVEFSLPAPPSTPSYPTLKSPVSTPPVPNRRVIFHDKKEDSSNQEHSNERAFVPRSPRGQEQPGTFDPDSMPTPSRGNFLENHRTVHNLSTSSSDSDSLESSSSLGGSHSNSTGSLGSFGHDSGGGQGFEKVSNLFSILKNSTSESEKASAAYQLVENYRGLLVTYMKMDPSIQSPEFAFLLLNSLASHTSTSD